MYDKETAGMKIVIIGAGSGFGGRLSGDILSIPALQDSTIALCDIDTERLEKVRAYVQRLIDVHKLPATCVAGVDRDALLPGAECVVTAVSIGGPAYWGEPYYSEINIPRKYGVDQFVGDTIGPGGVFRFLRTAATHLEFCKSMERHCPDALLLNYTNPMAMLTWLHSAGSSIENVGLCHSVQGTTKQLARALDVPYEEVSYLVAGINHQAWILRLRRNGEDLYPRLREIVETSEAFEKEAVRVEIMKQFGYYVTESTRHMSEYVPYFRRTEEIRDRFGLISRKVELNPEIKRFWEEDMGVEGDGEAAVPKLVRSHEYASSIIEARRTNVPFVFNGSVMNHGAITNLPSTCCVEIPCVVDAEGIHACRVGALPAQCAALNRSNINVQELAVEAVLNRDREAAFHAVALDPLTASVLTLESIREMFDELWQAEGELLDYFRA
jgi:alpha-galactosidase